MSTRTYSEKEAADLFRRAAEFQASRAHPDMPGLTLEELRRAAEAAGIDPAALDHALTVPARSSHEPTRFLGMVTSMHRSRFVPHATTEDTWGHTVRDLREHLGAEGETETLGTIREWKMNPLRFTAEPVEGGTMLTADATWHSSLKWGTWLTIGIMPMLLLAVLGAFAAPDANGAFILMSMLFTIGLGLSAYSLNDYRTKAKRLGAQIDSAIDSTVRRLADADASIPAQPAAVVPPQIALDDPDAIVREHAATRSRTSA